MHGTNAVGASNGGNAQGPLQPYRDPSTTVSSFVNSHCLQTARSHKLRHALALLALDAHSA